MEILEIAKQHDHGKKEISKLHNHLLWMLTIIEKIETQGPKNLCKKCSQKKAKYIPVIITHEDRQYDLSQICCEECKEALQQSGQSYSFTEISFRTFIRLHNKKRQSEKYIIQFLKEQFDLPKKITRYSIFKWFQSQSQNTEKIKHYIIPTIIEKEQYIIDLDKI